MLSFFHTMNISLFLQRYNKLILGRVNSDFLSFIKIEIPISQIHTILTFKKTCKKLILISLSILKFQTSHLFHINFTISVKNMIFFTLIF
jgi:hypothetical protein